MVSSVDKKISPLGGKADLVADLVSSQTERSGKAPGPSFKETLTQQLEKNDKKPEVKSEKPILKFSNHAVERMNSRGISFTPEQITKIEQGMQKASDKGAKEALFLTDDSAMIVSLKNNTVVTVMDKDMMKENVFTNIDSTILV